MINQILFKQLILNRYKIEKYFIISILGNIFQIKQQSKFLVFWYLFRREKKYFLPFHPRGSPEHKKIKIMKKYLDNDFNII